MWEGHVGDDYYIIYYFIFDVVWNGRVKTFQITCIFVLSVRPFGPKIDLNTIAIIFRQRTHGASKHPSW